jgi:hypothetical protein
MRLKTLGAVCATSAVAVPITAVPFALAEDPAPAAPAAAPAASAAQQPAPLALTPPGDMHRAAMATLANRHVYFARRYHRLLGDPLSHAERVRIRNAALELPAPKLRAKTRHLRHDIRALRRRLEHKRRAGAIPPQLEGIAQCESHGNPRAISPGGTYRGKYQFSYSTWASVGGKGDPAKASEAEQDRRAAKLYRTGGPGHWPVCGR